MCIGKREHTFQVPKTTGTRDPTFRVGQRPSHAHTATVIISHMVFIFINYFFVLVLSTKIVLSYVLHDLLIQSVFVY
jgi:hypothetical protein